MKEPELEPLNYSRKGQKTLAVPVNVVTAKVPHESKPNNNGKTDKNKTNTKLFEGKTSKNEEFCPLIIQKNQVGQQLKTSNERFIMNAPSRNVASI